MEKILYLDNAATTKPCALALKNNEKFNDFEFYNPSAKYNQAVIAKTAINDAKSKIISCFSNNFDLIFTSCGSESDNMAIFSYSNRGNILTTLGEHSAIHAPLIELKNKGYDSRFAKINKDGTVNVENLLSLVDKNTVLVSVMHVNNETGGINDVNNIAKQCKAINPRLVFHVDGVQAFGKIPFRPSDDIDLYSVSAHKINGLKGVGGLFKNKKLRTLKPLIYGGGQENGLRSGTENVFGIKVFESVALDKYSKIKQNYNKMLELKEYFLSKLDSELFTVISTENCTPYIISLSAVGLKGEVLLHKLEEDNIIIGTGSACSSKNPFSRVLKEAGYLADVLDGVIRISFTPEFTKEELDYVVEKLNLRANELKRTIKK